MRNILIYFSIKYQGDYFSILDAIKRKEQILEGELEKIENAKYKAITCIDNDYPYALRNSMCPPFVLFYDGDISLLSSKIKKIGVVGSRVPTKYGESVTNKVLDEALINKEYIIVSGLAKGIDAIAHKKALEHGQKTIAVLGCGVDICYPPINKDIYDEIKVKGLLLSEYPFNVSSKPNHFPSRNRIIAALSDAVLVTDAKVRSGTQITVKYALELGKDIMTVPHSILQESFCNVLLRQGAIPIINGKDIDEELY